VGWLGTWGTLPRLRRGVHRLEQSRLRDLYHEIAPGMITFGRLIGRSFQAQGQGKTRRERFKEVVLVFALERRIPSREP
jgi:hypothetical protein